jgi:type III restriction enzyme
MHETCGGKTTVMAMLIAWQIGNASSAKKRKPLFDQNRKVRSTSDMPSWWTAKPNVPTKKSHLSHCVFDRTWEVTEVYRIENSPRVAAWAKNDHLGFGIRYTWAA